MPCNHETIAAKRTETQLRLKTLLVIGPLIEFSLTLVGSEKSGEPGPTAGMNEKIAQIMRNIGVKIRKISG